jgi:hypothetical protein
MTPDYVYVASSWRNTFQPAVIHTLKAAGIPHYDFRHPESGDNGFAWSEIDPDWQQWTPDQYVKQLDHPLAVDGFGRDFAAMDKADTFVLILPCGRSAHLELGWAIGAGKRTAILLDDRPEPELMYKLVDHLSTSLFDLLDWLGVSDAG